MARLARYVVNAQGGVDPRSWSRTADYILDVDGAGTYGKGEKVGGVRVTNCGTNDPASATLLIEATQAANTRSKSEKTYHLVFSFPSGEQPPLETLHDIEDELCEAIGYADHQRVSGVHVDTDHLHVHVAINKVHPTGFQNIEPYYDKKRLMAACERLEVKHDLQRTNHGLGEKNERPDRAAGQRITLRDATEPGDRDSRFRRYLRESYNLPITERPEAKTLNGLRKLSSSHMARTPARASVLLPGDARPGVQQRGEEYPDGVRRAGNGHRADAGQRDGGVGAAPATIERQSGIETLATYVSKEVAPALREAKSWPAVHGVLAEHGLEIKPRGAGLVIGDADIPLFVRASQCSRDFSKKAMTDRLGEFQPAASKADEKGDRARKRYTPKPIHRHPSTAALYAQYQREKQQHLLDRKAGFAKIKSDNAAYLDKLKRWTKTQRAFVKLAKGPARRIASAQIRSQAAAARKQHRQLMKERREKLFKNSGMPSWADWLAQQAEKGNADALDVLRSREQREHRLAGDLLTARQADKAKTVVMERLKGKARKDGSMHYRTADGGMVVDRKRHVQAERATSGAALVALMLAAERFDGQPLAVDGTDEFKHNVAKLAGLHSVNVTFADPAMEQARQASLVEKEKANVWGGSVVAHGRAPYENNPDNKPSYFVTLRDASGQESTVWGVGLAQAMRESRAEEGDHVELENLGRQPVEVKRPVKDEETGKVVGTETAEVYRNTWSVKLPDGTKAPNPRVNRREGALVGHGQAPYDNKPDNKPSYFVTLRNSDGQESTVWGVDLARAIKDSGTKAGDRVELENLGRQPVEIERSVKDKAGQVVGTEKIQVHRNTWKVKTPSEAASGAPPKPAQTAAKDSADTVGKWIEKRNESRDKISSMDYHRLWQPKDAGPATYQGRRRMEDGSEVLLLKRGDDMLVKPASARVVAKASQWKVGRRVTLDARGRFINGSRDQGL